MRIASGLARWVPAVRHHGRRQAPSVPPESRRPSPNHYDALLHAAHDRRSFTNLRLGHVRSGAAKYEQLAEAVARSGVSGVPKGQSAVGAERLGSKGQADYPWPLPGPLTANPPEAIEHVIAVFESV